MRNEREMTGKWRVEGANELKSEENKNVYIVNIL